MSVLFRILFVALTLCVLCQCRRSESPEVDSQKPVAVDVGALMNAVDEAMPELAGRGFREALLAKSEGDLFAALDRLLDKAQERRARLAAGHVLRHLAARSADRLCGWLAKSGERCKPLWGALVDALPVLALKAPDSLPLAARAMPDPFMRQSVWRAFAEAQPGPALTAWQQQKHPGEIWPDAEDAMRELLNAGARTDPGAIASWLAAQPDAAQLLEKWQSHFLSTWCLRDAPGALAWCLEQGVHAGLEAGSWASKCAERVPSERTDWMRQMATMLPRGVVRVQLLERAALFDGKKNAAGARAWIAGLTDAADRDAAERGLRQALVVELPSGFAIPSEGDEWVRYVEERAALGLPETFAWAAGIRDAMVLREKALFATARLWAKSDRAAAERAVNGLEGENDRNAALAGMTFDQNVGGER